MLAKAPRAAAEGKPAMAAGTVTAAPTVAVWSAPVVLPELVAVPVGLGAARC